MRIIRQMRDTKLDDMLSFIELRHRLKIENIIICCNVIAGHTAELGCMLA